MNVQDIVPISEFRKNTKLFLDTAKDTPVYIRRGDDVFEIRLTGGLKLEPLTVPESTTYSHRYKALLVSADMKESSNKLPEYSSPRTKKDIQLQIADLQKDVDSADYENQDPDYWDAINKKKTKIDSLWKEWHSLE